MASINVSNNVTTTGNTVTINFTTDLTDISNIQLTKDNSTFINPTSFNSNSATFNIADWSNGTYSCKLKATYTEQVTPDPTPDPGPTPDPDPPTEPDTPTTPDTPSTGQALDDWDVYNNTYSYNYVAYMASQVGVKGKAIRITADKKTVTAVPTGGTGTTTTKDYVSGGLVTKKAFKYGTFTFKCKLSANNTYLWAMIWTLPDSATMARPEFDLWESWGSKTNNAIVQTYHAFDSQGNDKMNYLQANTPVDLTQEHEVKAVWTQDNVFKMYCDGVLKLTIKDYMVNWKTGEVDYQLWFLNLGLGTYANDAPNGTGWMEITDYKFEPVYTRDRVKQHTYCGNWTDGTAPSGPLPSSSGSSGGGTTEPDTPSDELQITSINVLSSTAAKTQINYTTSAPVTKHYFNMWYSGSDTGFTDGTSRVTDNGNNNYTMTFENALSAGTKAPAIKVADASGNTVIKTFSLTVTN